MLKVETLSVALLLVVAHNVDGFLTIPIYARGSSIRVSNSKVVATDECQSTVAFVLGQLSL